MYALERRRLDLPELPRVGDRAPARDAGRRRSSPWWRGHPAGWWNPARLQRAPRSASRSRRTCRTRPGSPGASSCAASDACAIAYFGDGATSEGAFHEGANFAGVMRAPLVLFCNNNQWAISTPVSRADARPRRLADKAVGYGIPACGSTAATCSRSTRRRGGRRAGARRRGPTFIEARHLPRGTACDGGRPERVHRPGARRGGEQRRVPRPLRGATSADSGCSPDERRRGGPGRGRGRDADRNRRGRGRAAAGSRPGLRERVRRPAARRSRRPRGAAQDPRSPGCLSRSYASA